MARYCFSFTVILILCICAGSSVFADDNSKKLHVAVFNFSAGNGAEAGANIARNIIESMLFESGRFYLLERSQGDLINRERETKKNSVKDPGVIAALGKRLFLDYAVVGSVDYVEKYIITVRLVSIDKGRIIRIYTYECEDLEELQETSGKIGGRIFHVLNGNAGNKHDDSATSLTPYIQMNAVYLVPEGETSDVIDPGYGTNLYLGIHGFFFDNASAGFKTGAYFFTAADNESDKALTVPLQLYFSYSFKIAEGTSIVPELSAGAAFFHLTHGTGAGFDMPENSEKNELEVMSEMLFSLHREINKGLDFVFAAGWGIFYEKDNLENYIITSIGLQYRF